MLPKRLFHTAGDIWEAKITERTLRSRGAFKSSKLHRYSVTGVGSFRFVFLIRFLECVVKVIYSKL